MLSVPLVVIVPFGAFRSLAVEQEDRTYELMSITALAPRQIVAGKLAPYFAIGFTQLLIVLAAVALFVGSCAEDKESESGASASADEGITVTVSATATEGATETGIDPSADDGTKLDVGSGNTAGGCGDIDLGCTDQIDLLFVIDNSGTMGEEQLNLARNFPLLIQQLENLTFATVTPERRQESRASWNRWDVINSGIVLFLILLAYLYFRG